MRRFASLLATLVLAVAGCGGLSAPAFASTVRPVATAVAPDGVSVVGAAHRSCSVFDSSTAPRLTAAPAYQFAAVARAPRPLTLDRYLLIPLVGFGLMGITANKISADKSSYFATDTTRQQHNLLVYDLLYAKRNYIVGTSTPGCATGSGNVKPKTANAVNYVRGGVPRAQLAATDNFWDLTTAAQGVGVVPVSSFIKYWLCVTAAEAMKVYSSVVAATAAGATFPAAPADGDTILGVLLVATNGATTFTPGTTSLGAAGITATYSDGSDGSEIMANQVSP